MIHTPNPAPERVVPNPGPVLSAGAVANISTQVTPMPGMRGTLLGWFRPFTAKVVQTQHEEGGTIDTKFLTVNSAGVLQPAHFEELDQQAGGDRSWSYFMLHCLCNLAMKTNDQVVIWGKGYRVMSMKDYTTNGYIEYRLTQAPHIDVPRA